MILLYFLYLNLKFYSNIFSAFWDLDHEGFYKLSLDSARLVLLTGDHWKILTALSCTSLIACSLGFDLLGYQKDTFTLLRFSYNFWEILNFNSGFWVNIIIEVFLYNIESRIRYIYHDLDSYIYTTTWTLIFLKLALILSGKDELILFVANNVVPYGFYFCFTLFIIIANIHFFYHFQSYVYRLKDARGINFKLALLTNCFDRDCNMFFLLELFMNLAGIAFSYFFLERHRNFFIFLFILGLLMPLCLLCFINEHHNSIKCFILNYLSAISSISVVCFSLGYI